MRRTEERGRSRVTVMVLLGLGIALLGALLLPRLLNEARPPQARTSQASICFAMLDDFTVPAPGRSRVSIRTLDRPALQVALAVRDGTTTVELAAAAADAVRGAAEQAGWDAPPAMAAAEHCLHLEDVVAVGGDPGTVGLGVSYALAAQAADGGPLRIRVSRSGAQGPGPKGRLGLWARRAASGETSGEATAAIQIAFDSGDVPEAILARLEEGLADAGWTYRKATDGDLVIRGLPDGGALGGLMLSVRYEELPVSPTTVLEWTLSLER